MQKFVFAVKVLGTIILIPVWVILEITHDLPDSKQDPVVKEQVEKTATQLSLNAEVKKEISITNFK
jgi:hypothetical protein